MYPFHFHAANLLSENCIESAELFSKLFGFKILKVKMNHAELESVPGFHLFFNKPSSHCPVNPGSISFSLPTFNIKEINLKPLELESYFEKENYASFLDSYKNRIWIFERKIVFPKMDY